MLPSRIFCLGITSTAVVVVVVVVVAIIVTRGKDPSIGLSLVLRSNRKDYFSVVVVVVLVAIESSLLFIFLLLALVVVASSCHVSMLLDFKTTSAGWRLVCFVECRRKLSPLSLSLSFLLTRYLMFCFDHMLIY